MAFPASVLRLAPDSEPSHPARKLVDLLLLMAIRDRATSLRLEPRAEEYRVTMTVGGEPYEILPPPLFLADRIARIFRVLAGMDISRANVEQSAPLNVLIGTGRAELRVKVGPIAYGHAVDVAIECNTVTPEVAESVIRGYGMSGDQDAVIAFTEEDA